MLHLDEREVEVVDRFHMIQERTPVSIPILLYLGNLPPRNRDVGAKVPHEDAIFLAWGRLPFELVKTFRKSGQRSLVASEVPVPVV